MVELLISEKNHEKGFAADVGFFLQQKTDCLCYIIDCLSDVTCYAVTFFVYVVRAYQPITRVPV
jgi:hypothetical protein